jgi:transcriptional regulator with XRE-family HTH domain
MPQKDKTALRKFGSRVREIRTAKGVTQRELAFSLGMEISQISRIERGLINTGVLNIIHIAEFLQVSPKDFFD